jgi:hypothetical protein
MVVVIVELSRVVSETVELELRCIVVVAVVVVVVLLINNIYTLFRSVYECLAIDN